MSVTNWSLFLREQHMRHHDLFWNSIVWCSINFWLFFWSTKVVWWSDITFDVVPSAFSIWNHFIWISFWESHLNVHWTGAQFHCHCHSLNWSVIVTRPDKSCSVDIISCDLKNPFAFNASSFTWHCSIANLTLVHAFARVDLTHLCILGGDPLCAMRQKQCCPWSGQLAEDIEITHELLQNESQIDAIWFQGQLTPDLM